MTGPATIWITLNTWPHEPTKEVGTPFLSEGPLACRFNPSLFQIGLVLFASGDSVTIVSLICLIYGCEMAPTVDKAIRSAQNGSNLD